MGKERKVPDQNQRFGLSLAAGFGALALIRYLWIGSLTWWLTGLGAAFLVLALVVPFWLDPVRTVWMTLAKLLGRLNAHILLTVVFACLITPMALWLRLLGKQPIRLGFRSQQSTNWDRRGADEFSPKRMDRQF